MSVLVVSWILALLTLFSLSFNREVRTDLRQTRLHADAVVSRDLAESGLTFARQLLLRQSLNDWDAPVEGWDRNAAFREISLGAGRFSLGYVSADGDSTIHGLQDEGRRIPWSDLNEEMLRRIPELDTKAREALSKYLESGGSAPPITLTAISELDARSAHALRRYVTLQPSEGVNINTAPPAVLEAVGVPGSAVGRIVSRRDGADGRAGTPDDVPFTSVLLPDGGLDEIHLDPEEAAAISYLARAELLTVRSNVYRVSSRGWLEDRQTYYEIDAVFARTATGGLEVLDRSERWKS